MLIAQHLARSAKYLQEILEYGHNINVKMKSSDHVVVRSKGVPVLSTHHHLNVHDQEKGKRYYPDGRVDEYKYTIAVKNGHDPHDEKDDTHDYNHGAACCKIVTNLRSEDGDHHDNGEGCAESIEHYQWIVACGTNAYQERLRNGVNE